MNKKIIILTVLVILGMVIFPTIYKVYQRHNEQLLVVVKKEFTYYAKNCYNAGVCKNTIVTLKDLYDNKYITDKLTNPINKKYYIEDSFVNLKTYEVTLNS